MSNKQLLGRIGQIVLVLLGISFITFALVMLSPGDPVRQMIAGNEDIVVSQQEVEALRHELGLDKPFIFQYLDWLGRAVQGDFGFSYMVKKACYRRINAQPACNGNTRRGIYGFYASGFHTGRYLQCR